MSEPSDKRRRTVCLFSVFYHFGVNIMKKRLIIILCVVSVVVTYLLWGNNSLTVSLYSVTPNGLPEQFDGYRIVQISDLHNKDFGKRLTDKIEELKPDIIVITGDIIDSYSTELSVAAEFVENACKAAPVYYVTGNHESRLQEEYASLRAVMEDAGVTVLDGRVAVIEKNGGEICLAGVDDPSFFGSYLLGENEIQFKEALSLLKEQAGGRVSVLLSHRPEYFEMYAELGFDLVFSGHAHGGQIRLPFIGGIFAPGQGVFPDYTSGVCKSGETSMIVSRGLGNSIFPFRVGNCPEVVVCELKCTGE